MAGKKGWFKIPGVQDGDRTIEEQLEGLDALVQGVSGKTVLDVGSGEGLIGIALAKAGATHVLGIDNMSAHLDVARRYAIAPITDFLVADANSFAPKAESFDIVLLLAILHKLKDPMGSAQRLALAAKSLVVVRLPPVGPVFKDDRSGRKLQNISAALEEVGFHLESDSRGTFDEWIGFYRRTGSQSEPVATPMQFPFTTVDEVRLQMNPETPPAQPEASPEHQAEQAHADEIAQERSEAQAPRPPADETVDIPTDFIGHTEPHVDMTTLPDANEPTATDALESGRELFPEPRRRRVRRSGGDQGGTS